MPGIYKYKNGSFIPIENPFNIPEKHSEAWVKSLKYMGYSTMCCKRMGDDNNIMFVVYETVKKNKYRFLACLDFGWTIDDIYFEEMPDLVDFLQKNSNWLKDLD